MRLRLLLLTLATASLACNALIPTAAPTVTPEATAVRVTDTAVPTRTELTPTPEPTATAAPSETPTLEPLAGGVRYCDYVPGVSVPAEMPPGLGAATLATPTPFALPPNTAVDAETTERQMRIFQNLVRVVEGQYMYPDFNGVDWPAAVAKYEALIQGGLTDEDFYRALNGLLYELGDEHSYFESPEQAAALDAQFAGQLDYVGVGVLVSSVPEAGRGVIILTFPGGAAAEAGLRPHDSIVAVDGDPLLDETGLRLDKVRGPEGTSVTLTIERPGEPAFDITLERRRITGATPIDYCLVPGTRIGYLFLPGLDEETFESQVRAALQAFAESGPLEGLVLDNRQNGGGLRSVLVPILGLFTEGTVGHFVSRTDTYPLEIQAEDINGSQDVPLVVLVDVDTASYGEVLSGVLQAGGRAVVVGQTTGGNVETLRPFAFEDGSRAWVSVEAFQPVGLDVGIWEQLGIVPDVHVPTRWDLFTEANDPALAAAVDILLAEE